MVENYKIAIVYTHFPHYRSAIFNQLANSEIFHFEFYFDPDGIEKSILVGDINKSHNFLATYALSGKFYFQPKIFNLILKRDFDAFIFLGNPYIITTWFAALFLRICKKNVFFWTHGWLREESTLKTFIRNIFYRLADSLLLYGNRAKKFGVAQGFSVEKLHVIYNSLDYNSQRNARIQLEKSKTTSSLPYFLTVARLISDVDLELAIYAIQKIQSRTFKKFELIVVGDGPLRSTLQATAERLQVPIRFLGAIYDEEKLAELFFNCIAVVSPGKVGLLAMHAFAYGAPVITHDDFDHQGPEVEAIEPGVTGAFFPRGDANALAKLMLDFLTGQISTIDRAKAISIVENYYTPTVQRQLIEEALANTLHRHESKK